MTQEQGVSASVPDAPRRVQLSRRKGWRMPENTVKVSRPGKWGNPFRVGEDGTAAECVNSYRALLSGYVCLTSKADLELQHKTRAVVVACLDELRGKNLACWCRADKPCHADVLLELANAQADRSPEGQDAERGLIEDESPTPEGGCAHD
jgi:hypothetical protein